MDVLIIEDEQYIHNAISDKLGGLTNITHSYDLENSLNYIVDGNYDLIILDLAIPSKNGLMDHDPQYGLQCFYKIKENAFGWVHCGRFYRSIAYQSGYSEFMG